MHENDQRSSEAAFVRYKNTQTRNGQTLTSKSNNAIYAFLGALQFVAQMISYEVSTTFQTIPLAYSV